MKNIILGCLIAAAISTSANAQDHSHHDHHNHQDTTPIGVMGSHLHPEGELMLSYRYSKMGMKGNRSGTNELTPSEVIADPRFMVAPTEMDMEMHMFGAMYGLSNDITLMAMVPVVRKVMDHVTGGGVVFTTETEGLGDIKLSSLVKLADKTHLNFGLSVPTGATNEYDTTPLGHQKLPYPMQLGSGTFDPIIGITHQDFYQGLNWGAQANAIFRVYDNSDDYHLGNEYSATTWVAKPLAEWLTGSLRLDARAWENISGADNQLTRIIPTAFSELRGGERVDLLLGFNIAPKQFAAPLKLEFGMPIYQRLEGPQLQTNYRFTIGTQYSF